MELNDYLKNSMKRFIIIFIVAMLLYFTPLYVYIGLLDLLIEKLNLLLDYITTSDEIQPFNEIEDEHNNHELILFVGISLIIGCVWLYCFNTPSNIEILNDFNERLQNHFNQTDLLLSKIDKFLK